AGIRDFHVTGVQTCALPIFPTPRGESTIAFLRRLTYQGAWRRYGRLTPAIRRRLEHELAVIEKLDVADAFLVAWDLVRFAQARRSEERRGGNECRRGGAAGW